MLHALMFDMVVMSVRGDSERRAIVAPLVHVLAARARQAELRQRRAVQAQQRHGAACRALLQQPPRAAAPPAARPHLRTTGHVTCGSSEPAFKYRLNVYAEPHRLAITVYVGA